MLFGLLFFSTVVLTNGRQDDIYDELPQLAAVTSSGWDATTLGGQGSARLSFERGELLQTPTLAAVDCAFYDLECLWEEGIDAFADLLFEGVKPVLDSIVLDQANFLTQTPASLTYEQEHVRWVANWSLTVVDLALGVLVVFAGYQIILGRTLGLPTEEATTLLSRLIVTFILAQSWQLVCGTLIDLNNALCLGMIQLLHGEFFNKVIESIKTVFAVDVPLGGTTGLFFSLVLALFLIVQILLLFWQMLVRLALIMLLVALSPLGLASLGSPLTAHWGQLWVSLFVHTVLIQFLQVTALALAGVMSVAIIGVDVWHLDQELLLQLVSTAMFFLILRLPSMLQAYMPSPLVGAGEATGAVFSGIVKRAAATL